MAELKNQGSDENNITKRVAGVTKGNKKLIIDMNAQGYFFIKFKNGGKLPSSLTGRYTRYEFAERDIARYLKE